jgi:hypothetical protein
MKRGPKPGKRQSAAPRAASADLGECPPELVAAGRELWHDAAAYLEANGRANRVYRHPLRMLCLVFEQTTEAGEIGISRMEACRRWLHELGLTPASAKGMTEGHGEEAQDGRARLLQLVARKAASE